MCTKLYQNRLGFIEDMTKHFGVFSVHSVERYSMSTYTGVANFQKTVRFLAHPVYSLNVALCRLVVGNQLST